MYRRYENAQGETISERETAVRVMLGYAQPIIPQEERI
jgi:hypothetical protein